MNPETENDDLPPIGHNGYGETYRVGNLAGDQLRSVIERIERLEEEKAALAADIKDVYSEAKGNGLHNKTIRKIVKIRKMDHAERAEEEHLLEVYKRALGMRSVFEDGE